MGVQQIFIVRHGETDYNVHHRWQGHLDVPLNDTGKKQAQALADYFTDQPIDTIISSDLKRAADTACAIAKPRQLKVHYDDRLREIKLGVFQGLTRAQICITYPQAALRWDNDDTYAVSGGESRVQLQQRAYQAWQAIIAHQTARQVLVVSHGGTIRLLLRRLFPETTNYVKLKNTSISIIECNTDGAWVPTALNITPHLS
ncbi:MAG: histidine phosphatase family protein [Anaerolineae bacterium]